MVKNLFLASAGSAAVVGLTAVYNPEYSMIIL